METRNVAVTLKKAKEWYNSNNSTLREVALQAFTADELKSTDFKSIRNFADVQEALGIIKANPSLSIQAIHEMECDPYMSHIAAINKVDLILKALNSGWSPSLTEGRIYYPYVKIYKADKVPNDKKKDIAKYFTYNGEKYVLVGGDYACWSDGLSAFFGDDGYCDAVAGLLGCKSEEIARHMSKYFAKEIFEACYAAQLGFDYEWV